MKPPVPIQYDLTVYLAEIAKRSLKKFIQEFWSVVEPTTPLIDNWSIDCFCEHLENIHQIRNLLINVCPGSTKSLIFCVFFPIWRWLRSPSERFLMSSYSLQLSERDSLKSRQLIESQKFQAYYGNVFKLSDEQNTKLHFANDKTGYRQAITAGFGGTATGLKGDIITGDDLHSAQDAESQSRRETVIRWFADVFYNRLNDFNTGIRIVVGQRIHRDDLYQFIISNYTDWTHLILPWDYKPTTYVSPIGWSDPRTEPGEPLWPNRFPQKEIANLRRRSGSFSAQWNQEPRGSDEDSIFLADHFRYFQEHDDHYKLGDKVIGKDQCFTIMSCDPAMSESKVADYSVIAIADVAPGGHILLKHLVRERLGPTKLLPKLHYCYSKYKPSIVLVEDYGFGKMVIANGRQEGIPIRPVRTKRASNEVNADIKVIRSLSLQIACEDGKFWFPDNNESWIPIMQAEMLDFPGGKYDDCVDATSYLAAEAKRRARGSETIQAIPQDEKTQEQWFWQRLWAD